MTAFDTYGTSAYTPRELSDLLASRLAATFIERESYWIGSYFLATLADTTSLKIQPNAIPGDDGEDDLYEDEHPDMTVLLLVTSPVDAESLNAELAAVEGLTRLRSSAN
ncbi:hypothetical protein ACGF0D_18220 [Kitasatospora sp. NPDC048298]|uniref:hypothetical protein n=1 Tax=Kitasatospora sp. NPDC048298 TaxID=3364049 RepID=UPI00371247EF